MTSLFIASRRVEHDGSREVIAAGSLIGGIWRSARPGRSDTVAAAIVRGRLKRERAEAAARETGS
jgi:hypothetical protein